MSYPHLLDHVLIGTHSTAFRLGRKNVKSRSLRYSTQMETLLQWANILHDGNLCVVRYWAKNRGFFTIQIFSQEFFFFKFLSFEKKSVFHNLNLKMMKINKIESFLRPDFLTTRNKPPNINIQFLQYTSALGMEYFNTHIISKYFTQILKNIYNISRWIYSEALRFKSRHFELPFRGGCVVKPLNG